MKRDAFLGRLNKQAARYGKTVTRSTLESWVKADYFEGVRPGTHEWTRNSYRSALQVCRLRSREITDANETRIRLWLQGASIPLDRLKSSAVGVVRKLRAKLKRQTSSADDPRIRKAPSGQTKKGFETSAAKAAPEFRSKGFKLSGDDVRNASALMHYGFQPESKIGSALIENLGIDPKITSDVHVNVEQAFSGLLGNPDEIESALESRVMSATIEQFVAARRDYRLLRFGMQRGAPLLLRAAPQFRGLGALPSGTVQRRCRNRNGPTLFFSFF